MYCTRPPKIKSHVRIRFSSCAVFWIRFAKFKTSVSLYLCRAFREIGRVCIGSLYKKDLGKFLPTKTRDLNSCPQRLEFLLTNCDNVSPASAFYSPLTCKHRILQYWSLGPTLGLWCLTMPFSWSFIETVLPRSSSLNFMTADSDSHDNWHPGRIAAG